MNPLPVLLLLAIEDGIFILGQHLLLNGHLGLPPLHLFRLNAYLRQRLVNSRDDIVNASKTLALARFLEFRYSPRGLPVRRGQHSLQSDFKLRMTYQRSPPDSTFVALNAPNMVVAACC